MAARALRTRLRLSMVLLQCNQRSVGGGEWQVDEPGMLIVVHSEALVIVDVACVRCGCAVGLKNVNLHGAAALKPAQLFRNRVLRGIRRAHY